MQYTNSLDKSQKAFTPTALRHNYLSVSKLEENPQRCELVKNGHLRGRQVTNVVAKNDANLALSPRFRHVSIESSL
ncbi:hypothetical protein TNCV_448101 [Trichonephila clavipes]|nr:hypothetical protein TNCV_448101 [Trichonephila clavipes]